MTDRLQVEQLVRDLHTARLEGDLERLCALYADEARLRIAGSTDGKPIAIAAAGMAEIRPWLSVLVKTFRLTQYTILSLSIDARRAHFLSYRILRAHLTFCLPHTSAVRACVGIPCCNARFTVATQRLVVTM